MADVRIVLNSAGIRALLKSSGIAGVCEAQAEKMTRAAGVPYVHDVYIGRTRVNAAGKTKDSALLNKKETSGKRRKVRGNWVTVNGERRFVKGYARKDKNGKTTYAKKYRKK